MAIPAKLASNGCVLENPTRLNVIVGRNGAGKSRFLRAFSHLQGPPQPFVRYVSPERAGSFEYNPNIEHTERQQKNWIEQQRQRNQAENFKQASALKLRELALRFAERLETDVALRSDLSKTFASTQLAKINAMLTNVVIERAEGQQFIFRAMDGKELAPNDLSSGESELIALATEISHFFEKCDPAKLNILLLDEPDVHLHPDLQARLARFLIAELRDQSPDLQEQTMILVATHSTPLISELSRFAGTSLGTKAFSSMNIQQEVVSAQLQKMAPFFGHPLSQIINGDVPVILEGEDDERVWQQASRTTQGRLKLFACLATSVNQQTELEKFADKLLSAMYDEPKAFSIRDGDGIRGALPSVGCVSRFRLQCYAVENLVTTDDVLLSLGTDWNGLVDAGKKWCDEHPDHKDQQEMLALLSSSNRGRDTKIKNVRQLIPAILGTLAPWEAVVGKVIGRISNASDLDNVNGIVDYIGRDALVALGLLNAD